MYLEKEPTILTPSKTQFTIEVLLQDTEYIYEMGQQYGEVDSYKFTAQPIHYDDCRLIEDMVEQAKETVYINAGPHSKKNAVGATYDKYHFLLFNQLFAPKVSGEQIEFYNLHQRQARIKGHLRENPMGVIYLQADYVDCGALPEQQFVCSASEYCDLDDF